ncbi:MAG: hypothetical protein HY730_07840 [Candidatus Tectomicrobia bacterium]|uniref:Uncharacterized protein n=1 Tax=Tectimicrobiota bacterium TaxID=2528274 RepID=A0A933GLU2_UNCTE|nr:hypothetical protein [Candidatus Tectomicrobia bacterium]
MNSQKFAIVFREPLPPAKGRYPGYNPRTEKSNGLICKYDVAVTMRHGTKI